MASAPQPAQAASTNAVDLWPACTTSGHNSGSPEIIACTITVIMDDGTSLTGTYQWGNGTGRNVEKWSRIGSYVVRDGGYMRKAVMGFGTSSSGSGDAAIENTPLVFGLKNKPVLNKPATVAAVPTTGAPNSDLVLPATLLAAGMVGGGLILRKRRDRGRA